MAIERHCVRCGSGDHGKPRLADTAAGVHFSLAQSGPHVVVAVSRAGPVGIDVESLKPNRDYRPLHRKTLTAARPPRSQRRARDRCDFLRTWVRKEAVTKAVGTGLATPFDSFAVGGGERATLLTWPDDPSLVERTTLRDLPGDPDRPAAVAVLARDVRISQHDGAPVLHARADLRFEDARAARARNVHRAPRTASIRSPAAAPRGGDQDLRQRDRCGQRAGGEATRIGDGDGLLGGGQRGVRIAERQLGSRDRGEQQGLVVQADPCSRIVARLDSARVSTPANSPTRPARRRQAPCRRWCG